MNEVILRPVCEQAVIYANFCVAERVKIGKERWNELFGDYANADAIEEISFGYFALAQKRQDSVMQWSFFLKSWVFFFESSTHSSNN